MTAAVFGELVGQEPVVEQLGLAAAAAAARTPGGSPPPGAAPAGSGMTHAWLFTGPPGSGRSVAARAFAGRAAVRRPGVRAVPVLPPGRRGQPR